MPPPVKDHWPDPDIVHGHFRVLPRTDGTYAVIDERKPLGKRTVKTYRKLQDAAKAAELWAKQGF